VADLAHLAKSLPRRGITVSLIEMPWHVAGRRIAAPPPVLDECFIAAVKKLRPRTPVVLGGRSAGARVACRTGRRLGAVAVLALAFPLHPPRRPERSRVAELTGARLPVLVVQGERDALGAPHEFPVGTTMTRVPHADHSFAVPRTAGVRRDDVLGEMADAVHGWLDRRLHGQP
jgi:predicted alpha/beta-hydrolase family hydrolase